MHMKTEIVELNEVRDVYGRYRDCSLLVCERGLNARDCEGNWTRGLSRFQICT